MNFSDFITHHGKRVNKEHFIHLILISRVDGKVDPSELELLHKEGRKFGLTDPEIDKLIADENVNHYHPPYGLDEKFEQLYNIAQMILADDVVTESEMKIMKRFAIEAGFADNLIDELLKLLLEGVAKGEDEDKLFSAFKRTILK